LAFAREGAKVAINYTKSEEAAPSVLDEIKEMGTEGLSFKVDVANHQGVILMLDEVINRFGQVDILANNAGITKPAMLHKMTEEQWDQVVDVHLKGAFNAIQAV
jgi:3-oxoacyl-[acyl-carrier protein] reductase